MKNKSVLAWHFVGNTLRDGRPLPADGEILKFDGTPFLCRHGLHASVHPYDALCFAPGPILCRVKCGGTIIYSEDKLVCTERTIIARADATEALRYFARMQALSVLDSYPGEPDEVVLNWLMAGDDQSAAYSAARSAACSAADSAAYGAAYSAADSVADSAADSAAYGAARSAAYSAADSTADSTADGAAYGAARSAAYSAACSAAYDAARSAAYSAADSAAYDAARSAAYSAARKLWAQLVKEAFE